MAIPIVNYALLAAAVVLSVPTLVLCVQLFASCLPRSSRTRYGSGDSTERERLAVLIPAHNEEAGIRRTIDSIKEQMLKGDRLIVIADNCEDRTEQIARHSDVEVVVRRDMLRRGKGHALQAGYNYLLATGPCPLIVFVDADCTITKGSLSKLSRAVRQNGRPAQALDVMHSQGSTSAHARLSDFAWLIRNQLRPAGYARLGLGCHLMGTGMAIRTTLLHSVPLGTGHIVEDNVLGAELTLKGHAPQFCEDACVVSEFPKSEAGRVMQRSRWVHGYLQVMGQYAFALIGTGMKRQDPRAFFLGLDLLVPPLTLLVLANLTMLGVGMAWFAGSGSIAPLVVSGGAAIAISAALTMTWFVHARQIVSFLDFVCLPAFFRMMLRIVANFFLARPSGWTRSDRS